MQAISAKPTVFWGWNGDVREEEMIRQLTDFREKGIGGVFVHARAGLKIGYMSDKWLALFLSAAKTCEKLGMDLWIYDEDGWPSGFAGGKVLAVSDEYKARCINCFTGSAKGYEEDETPKETLLGVYCFTEGGFVRVADYKNSPCEPLYFLYVTRNDYYIDVTNRDAVQCFIEETHEKYKAVCKEYFGRVIKGIFTDEPHYRPDGIAWGKYVAEAFEREHGYDVSDALPYLFVSVGEYRKHRYNYWKTLNGLFERSYMQPYARWCEENGLMMTGHLVCEDGLVDQVTTSGGVMPLYRHMQLIGVDALGNRLVSPVAFKQAESVASQYGNGRVLSETFAGTGYDATFEELLWLWDYQASMGVNLPCLSISMYSIVGNRKRDYPQFFSYQMPWWGQADRLFHKMEYINDRLLHGNVPTDFLIIHPKTTVWQERGANDGERTWAISSQLRNLTEAFNDLGVCYSFGDEDLMKGTSAVKEGKLIVGKRSYSAVVLPMCQNLYASTLALLREFALGGGCVYVMNEYPKYVDGVRCEHPIDFPAEFIVNRRDFWNKALRVRHVRDIELIEPVSRKTVSGLNVAQRIHDGYTDLFVCNRSRTEKVSFRFKIRGRYKIVREGLNGEREDLSCTYNKSEDYTFANDSLEGMGVAFYRIEEGEEKAQKSVSVKTLWLNGFVAAAAENAYAIDKLQYAIDGEGYSEKKYFIDSTNELYARINRGDQEHVVSVRYTFSFKGKATRLFACCEIEDGEVFINGNKVSSCGYYLDHDIGKFDISAYVKEGENEILLRKAIPPYRNDLLGKEVFQSVTNVDSYPYYLESVFLTGDFDVCNGEVWEGDNCIWAKDGDFWLQAVEEQQAERYIDVENITKQNKYFYTGSFSATQRITVQEEGRYYLHYDRLDAVSGSVEVNGIPFELYGNRIDVTSAIRMGENEIKLILYSGLRNLFGAHHHKYGKQLYTGPSVFEGYCEWQDVVINPEIPFGSRTYVPDYSFVDFGVKGLRIELEKVRDEEKEE